MNNVMCSDPRRRFTFGFTAENTTMRIWFCSRLTVVATQPFDYFKVSHRLAIVPLRIYLERNRSLEIWPPH